MGVLEAPSVRSDAAGWAAAGLLAAGATAAVLQRGLGVGPSGCILRAQFGVPCPTCGLSTVGVHLARLEVADAVRVDVVGAVLLLSLLVVGGMQLVRTFVRPIDSLRWPLPAVVPLALLIAHWALTLTGVVHLAPLT